MDWDGWFEMIWKHHFARMDPCGQSDPIQQKIWAQSLIIHDTTSMPWNWFRSDGSEHRTLTLPRRCLAGEAFQTDGRLDKDVEVKETPKKRQCKKGPRQGGWHWRAGKLGASWKTATWLLIEIGWWVCLAFMPIYIVGMLVATAMSQSFFNNLVFPHRWWPQAHLHSWPIIWYIHVYIYIYMYIHD